MTDKEHKLYLREVEARDPEYGGDSLLNPVSHEVYPVHDINHPGR